MPRSIFALPFLALVACAAETSPTTDSTGTQPGAASGSSETTSGSGAGTGQVYSISCQGDISLKCIGGPPGTNCGGGEGERPNCHAQDVKFHYAPPALRCVGIDVYEWNGEACVAHGTQGEGGQLKCQGKDCEQLFKTKDACESHRAACLGN